MAKYLKLDGAGNVAEEQPVSTSAGAGDAGKMIELGSGGQIDPSMIPGSGSASYTASEAIGAGDLVNVWDDAGTVKVRKADASTSGKRAHGFAPSAIGSGASGNVTLGLGTISGLSTLTLGAEYFLSATTPGGITTTPPAATGNIVQRVGVAKSATELEFHAGGIVVRV